MLHSGPENRSVFVELFDQSFVLVVGVFDLGLQHTDEVVPLLQEVVASGLLLQDPAVQVSGGAVEPARHRLSLC